jgi:type I restriction-modification system DNA methylase subunit
MTTLEQLVKRFADNIDRYKHSSYNETQVRREFIDPFFALLDWDVDNHHGFAEQYKDVIHEDAIKVGGSTKAPDYSFRIGGQRKFFVEAKKPSVDIRGDIHPAYQLRRYAWSAKLPLSILTDFEEFAVYDCRIKPQKNDKASTARVMYYRYDEYIDKWDEIANVFHRESIKKGSFDRYADSSKKKRGTAEVDDAFLIEMENWRELLARNFALRNGSLSTRALNEAVQRTIDRIVFLRICEDRGIEKYGQLQSLINVNDVYSHLRQIFLQADQKYNSGLFHFQKETARDDFDNWTLELSVDDKTLKEILKRLYYPESPYEFSVLPSSILGQVYERFLGKVIRLTPGHQAKIEEKPEVRKAGGVFYTPTYVVDYIVKNTIGILLGARSEGSGAMGVLDVNEDISKNQRINSEEADDKNISGTGSLETSDGFDGNDIQSNIITTTRGEVWTDQSNAEGSSFDSSEHSRGARQGLDEGISLPSVSGKGITGRAGDSIDNSRETEFRSDGGSNKYLAENAGSRKDAVRSEKIIENKNKKLTPRPSSLIPTLKICDPACGSGSFLIVAYQYLLDWYLEQYTKKPEKYLKGNNPKIYELKENEYRLTTSEKKRILLDNIYGVDIDSQAVEVTKLSLLLKVLEGETEESLGLSRQYQMKFAERALPDLSNNIKCGNSLIGSDFYDGRDMSLFGEDDHLRINVFDWEEEFPEVFAKGGFDAIIGNPPYVRNTALDSIQKNYYDINFDSAFEQYDLYYLFIEKGVSVLKSKGLLGFINPIGFLNSSSGYRLRNILLELTIDKIVDVSNESVFKDASTYPIVMIINKIHNEDYYDIGIGDITSILNQRYKFLNTSIIFKDTNKRINIHLRNIDFEIIEGIKRSSTLLANICKFTRGMQKNKITYLESDISDIASTGNEYVFNAIKLKDFQKWEVLNPSENILHNDTKAGSSKRIIFEKEKIIIPRFVLKFQVAFDKDNYILDNIYVAYKGVSRYNLKYLLGILNSSLINFYYVKVYSQNHIGGGYFAVNGLQLKDLPIRTIDFDNPDDVAKHDKMVQLVESMLELNKRVHADGISTQEKKITQKQIEITDKQIDQLVYELYDLTEEEIKIVEGE